jgi:hypothetical protein
MGRNNSHRRANALWTDERNLELVELLRTESTLTEIAQRIGRSTTAVRGQIRKLTPPNLPLRGHNAEQIVRELLQSSSYDWRAVLRERKARYWDGDILRQGWE